MGGMEVEYGAPTNPDGSPGLDLFNASNDPDFQEYAKSEEFMGLARSYGGNASNTAVFNNNEKIQSMLSSFNGWKKKRDTVRGEREEYLKAVGDNPGRSATILVPAETDKTPTSLISGSTARKPLIG